MKKEEPKKKSRRGFASLDPKKLKEISRKGGKNSHKNNPKFKKPEDENKSSSKKLRGQ